jgi:PAS domain S-box-containing protein
MEQPLRILLLEDSPTDAELIRRLLIKEKGKCDFFLATDGDSFRTGLKEFAPDVVVSDNSLPQFNSTQALEITRQWFRHMPFILVTGTVSEEFAAAMISKGADDYILKDRLTRLPAAIDNAIKQRSSEKEKTLALQQLIKSEQKYRSLVERISDGFLAMDINWNITYINSIAEEMQQRKPGELLGKNVREEFPQAIGRAFFNGYEEALRTGNNIHVEEYSLAANKWIYASAYPSPTGVSIFFRDITEQRKAQEEAHRSEERYRIFLERITDAFIAFDRNWCYTYLNKQAGELIRRNTDEIIGKNVWEEFPEAIGSATYEAFHKAMNEQHYITNIDYFEPLDLWHENYIYPSKDGISVFIRDITEKKKLEIELAEQQRREQLRSIAAALEAQEKERNAIGIELHDNVNQILVGTKLVLGMIKNDPVKNASLVQSCFENIQQAINENRKIAHELVSPDLDTQTLLQQLSNLCIDMLEAAGLHYVISSEEFNEAVLTGNQKLTIYRIAQEQCTNIVKYAKAREVMIVLTTTDKIFTMSIRDDGQGMEKEKTAAGIGLRNINGRLSVFNGTSSVITSPGNGFELRIRFLIK